MAQMTLKVKKARDYEQETNKDHDSMSQPKDVLQEGTYCVAC